jgi:hypothetical protein
VRDAARATLCARTGARSSRALWRTRCTVGPHCISRVASVSGGSEAHGTGHTPRHRVGAGSSTCGELRVERVHLGWPPDTVRMTGRSSDRRQEQEEEEQGEQTRDGLLRVSCSSLGLHCEHSRYTELDARAERSTGRSIRTENGGGGARRRHARGTRACITLSSIFHGAVIAPCTPPHCAWPRWRRLSWPGCPNRRRRQPCPPASASQRPPTSPPSPCPSARRKPWTRS